MKDDERDQEKVARREFMRSSAAGTVGAVVGLSVLGAGLKETLAEAQRTGKPLLTEESLNGLFATGGERSKISAAGEAKRDVKGFIRSRFTLTAPQEEQLESLSQDQLARIRGILESAEQPGCILTVKFGRLISHHAQPDVAKKKCESFEIRLIWTF